MPYACMGKTQNIQGNTGHHAYPCSFGGQRERKSLSLYIIHICTLHPACLWEPKKCLAAGSASAYE